MIGVNCTGGVAGRIEICVDGEWRAVCADEMWTIQDAITICQQFGHTYTQEALARFPQVVGHCGQSCFGRSDNLKGIRQLKCETDKAARLIDCSYNITNEQSCTEEAGVVCGNKID